ncbi:MAG: hypothetical protein ACLFV2_05200 [Desulfurivibrionaceae bacterium]
MFNKKKAENIKYLAILLAACSQLILLFSFQVPRGWAEESPGTGTTVLIYHRFGEDKYPTTNVSVEKFKQQMAWLKANDYKVIPLSRLVKSLHQGEKLPEKSVVITIDDGYRST